MPLRDHFRSPLDDSRSWDELHGAWPTVIVMALNRKLPTRYVAAPRVHLGTHTEIEQDEYAVRVYDVERQRRLVAAVEIVSPANKDRPEHRRTFVAKCAALLQQNVSVTLVDLVTTRRFNLYAELLELIGQVDPSFPSDSSTIYAATCRWARQGDATHFRAWADPLAIGQPLPTLPLWLADNLAVPLELEETYEETCAILRIA